jgi:hypothetical protein
MWVLDLWSETEGPEESGSRTASSWRRRLASWTRTPRSHGFPTAWTPPGAAGGVDHLPAGRPPGLGGGLGAAGRVPPGASASGSSPSSRAATRMADPRHRNDPLDPPRAYVMPTRSRARCRAREPHRPRLGSSRLRPSARSSARRELRSLRSGRCDLLSYRPRRHPHCRLFAEQLGDASLEPFRERALTIEVDLVVRRGPLGESTQRCPRVTFRR